MSGKENTNYTLLESVIWDSFLSGNKEAYTLIYNRYAQSMYLYGIHLCKNSEIVEDCIHDIFVKLYTDRHKLPPVKSIKQYLLTSLRNTIYNQLNKKNTEFNLDISDTSLLPKEQCVEERFIQQEEINSQKVILKKIDQLLTDRQKQAIYLRYIENLPFNEIAQMMNITVQTAKNIIQEAFKKIRTSLPKNTYIIPLIFALFQ